MCARTHFEIFDKNLILHSKFQKKSMLMTQYRLLSHRKWLSIRYWGMLRNALLWGPWSLKFRHLLNRWPWPNIVGCHYCCGPTKPPILDLFAITQHSILSHNKLLSIEYWVLKDTESLYFTISTLCIDSLWIFDGCIINSSRQFWRVPAWGHIVDAKSCRQAQIRSKTDLDILSLWFFFW